MGVLLVDFIGSHALATPLINKSTTHMRYLSLGVTKLKLLKSIQILSFLFCFKTGIIFDSHSTYLIGWMKLAFNNCLTSSLTFLVASDDILLGVACVI